MEFRLQAELSHASSSGEFRVKAELHARNSMRGTPCELHAKKQRTFQLLNFFQTLIWGIIAWPPSIIQGLIQPKTIPEQFKTAINGGPIVLFKTLSAAVYGIDAELVEIEVNLTPRPGDTMIESIFTVVGLPDMAVRESRERIRAAISNSGYYFPAYKITVNLAPADVKKGGSAFDLPIAVGILGANGELNKDSLSENLLVGELALDGRIRTVRGSFADSHIGAEERLQTVISAGRERP